MKILTYISVLIFVFLFRIIELTAQEYRIPATNTRDGKLILKDFTGNLQVEGYDGKDIVFFKASFNGDNVSSTSKQAKELNPSLKGMPDNSGIGLNIENSGNQITVKCILPDIHTSEYKVKMPNNYSLKIVHNCERSKDIIVSEMRNEVEMSNCQSIKLLNVIGSIVLSTINGNIELENCAIDKDATLSLIEISGNIKADISRIDTKEPISLISISGNIILTLPAKISADFNLNSISGIIESDFDFPDENKNQVIGTQINYPINGGGVKINISTVSGNISLRKVN